jgi:hypothetical protein
MAQEEFVPPQAKLITRFPFTQISGGIVIVRAQFDNFPDSLNFVFDTGSGGISLDSVTATYLKVKWKKAIRPSGVSRASRSLILPMDHTLKLQGIADAAP